MKYNPKNMVRGALTLATGLAILASTACQIARVTGVSADFDAKGPAPSRIISGRLVGKPTIVQGNPNSLQFTLREANSNRNVQITYPKNSYGSYVAESTIFPELKTGSQVNLGIKGTNSTDRISTDELKSYSVKY